MKYECIKTFTTTCYNVYLEKYFGIVDVIAGSVWELVGKTNDGIHITSVIGSDFNVRVHPQLFNMLFKPYKK